MVFKNFSESYIDPELPALICMTCNGIYAFGGIKWEEDHPSIILCHCFNRNKRKRCKSEPKDGSDPARKRSNF